MQEDSVNILLKKIYIWGTGIRSQRVWPHIATALSLYGRIRGDVGEIVCFIDKNEKIQMEGYRGWRVISPSEYLSEEQEDGICIIAIENCDEIRKQLKNKRYCTYYDSFCIINQELLANRKKLLNLEFMKHDKLEECFMHDLSVLDKLLPLYNQRDYNAMFKVASHAEVIAALSFMLGYRCDKFKKVFDEIDSHTAPKKSVKTIGVYYNRYYNGGVEKVLSLLMPVLLGKGYKIVFFTDEYEPDKEYPIPKEIIRIHMRESKYNENLRNRLNEFERYVKEYRVDCMCLHAGIFDKEFPYIIAFFKLIQIPSIVELHGIYSHYVGLSNGLGDQIPLTLQMADQVIVVSRENAKYWNDRMVYAKYIQNPIECMRKSDRPRRKNELLWVGRINVSDNQVFDLIDVMRIVHKKVPEAVLRVVGGGENYLVQELMDKINANDLRDCIILEGYQTDLADYYQQASLLILTINKGGFPTVICEAMQYGLPIIGYGITYLELLKEENGCLLSPLGDTAQLAENVVKVMLDEKIRESLECQSFEAISQYMALDIGKAWEEMFHAL